MIPLRAAAATGAFALAVAAACTIAAAPARAAEYRSVSATAAVMYDAPSAASRKLFIAPRGMPVEVVAQSGAWIKVRDFEGALTWVERAALGAQRTVVARGPFVTVRAAAQEGAAAVLRVDRGVVLDLLDAGAATGWVHVRHRDGVDGWVRASEVWGL